MNPIQTFAGQVTANVEKVIVGKRPAIEMALVALLCDGHALIEDVPGVGKTMLARAAPRLEKRNTHQVNSARNS